MDSQTRKRRCLVSNPQAWGTPEDPTLTEHESGRRARWFVRLPSRRGGVALQGQPVAPERSRLGRCDRPLARADDRTAEVAGQGRTELRNATIIGGQLLQAIGRLPVIGGEELFPARLPVQRSEARRSGATANAEARNQTHASEDTAKKRGLRAGPLAAAAWRGPVS